MKIAEIRERTDAELRTLVHQLHEDLYRARVKKATNQLEDTNTMSRIRRDIARVKTVMQARRIGVEASKQG